MTRSRSTLPTRRLRVHLWPAGVSGSGPKLLTAYTEFERTSRNLASEPLTTKRREHSWPELIAAAPVINKRSGGQGTKGAWACEGQQAGLHTLHTLKRPSTRHRRYSKHP